MPKGNKQQFAAYTKQAIKNWQTELAAIPQQFTTLAAENVASEQALRKLQKDISEVDIAILPVQREIMAYGARIKQLTLPAQITALESQSPTIRQIQAQLSAELSSANLALAPIK